MKPKNPRLQFAEAELEDSRLKEHIRRADKAADKAEAARAKIPKKKKKVKKRTVDPATGKETVRLHFEEVNKPAPSSKLTHAAAAAPGQTVAVQVHRQISEAEEDNVGLQSAHKLEETAEGGARLAESAYHSHKLKPYRAAARAERKLEKANVEVLYQKAMQDNPGAFSNPLSRWQQKQAIKKQYAAARAGKAAGQATNTAQQTAHAGGALRQAAQRAADGTKEAANFVWKHKRGFGIAIALFLILCFFLNGMSSCSILLEGGTSGLAGSTYPCRDEDMLGAEAAYAAMEADLQYELDNYESLHPDYDEYHYELDDIGHDPYVLISFLTAYYQREWTLSEVQGLLATLFDCQSTLTENVVVETRYRTETRTGTTTSTDPVTGETTTEEYEYEVEVPYDYYICYVTLENFDLSHLPVYFMSEEQLSMYAVYMATLGNRPDLFPQSEYPNASSRRDYFDYDVPPEALEDEVFAAMLKEAEKYLGYPYVWGGSSPSTSFDCSGFVSWVINHSGWNVGRLGANGLLGICTPISSADAKPGDLIFFQGTYNTSGASHVGIYVGNGMMIHCGDPISYANINTSYWQQHFYTFGRLP